MKSSQAIEAEKMTLEEYIAFEETADVRHEFFEGKLYAMPGTTDTHNTICGNIYIALRQLLKNTSCKVFMENVKVMISHEKHYTYPDVFVTCDERDLENPYIKKHPSLIVEVASPSTKVYDKTDKFLDYRKIESLRNYLIVDTEKQVVECYTKEGEGWTAETYIKNEDEIVMKYLGVKISLSAIYE